MFCRKCGTENKDDANFCKKCGENFKNLKSIVPENKPIEQVSHEPSNNRIGILNTNSFSVMSSNLNKDSNQSIFDMNYDVFDSTNTQLIAKVRKINSGILGHIGSNWKDPAQVIIDIFDEKGQKFTRIKKGFFGSNIEVLDSNEQRIGKYRINFLGYEVFDNSNQLIAKFNTNYLKDKQGNELVKITSKGLLDKSYVVELCPQFKEPEMKKLLLPALFCLHRW